ncbi:tetratricopeptide repeat protein [Pseudodesulfovibrio sp.]|uniref:tetratricopeptide repeat protein n=1 Tax=Pseudodesulfovibrio sp. TaxID=2035812 RepID=UPI002622EE5F|nr:tetratricopeptide repeat protein [Pseudodesulfovibrio sp.]MDD3313201.1 tetratricopeptide repeat protein [Pseudodesulfovibrio sp.]
MSCRNYRKTPLFRWTVLAALLAAFSLVQYRLTMPALSREHLAWLLSESGRPVEAAPLLRDEVMRDPFQPELLYGLACCLYRSGEARKSFDYFCRAIANSKNREPLLSNAFFSLGGACMDMKEYKGAVSAYSYALEFGGPDAEALYYRGVALDEGGELDRAVADMSASLELLAEPEAPHTWATRESERIVRHHLGVLFIRLGRPGEAVPLLAEAMAPDGNLPYVLYALAYARMELGAWGPALELFGRAAALSPADPDIHGDALGGRAFVLLRLGRDAEAARVCDEALQWGESPSLYYNRACANGALGRYDQAVADCGRALALDPDHAEAGHNRRCYAAMRAAGGHGGEGTPLAAGASGPLPPLAPAMPD